MERRFVRLMLLVVLTLVAIGALIVVPLANRVENLAAVGKTRDWFDMVDLVFRLVTIMIFACGLLGTFAVLTSLRANVYSQMYTRFQGVLLRLAQDPELFDKMKRDEYTVAEDDPYRVETPTNAHRFIANAMVNLYEEAFMLHEARILNVIDYLPNDYWLSMLGSMRAAYRLKYLRTHWEVRQIVFTPKFNRFVREQILPYAMPLDGVPASIDPNDRRSPE